VERLPNVLRSVRFLRDDASLEVRECARADIQFVMADDFVQGDSRPIANLSAAQWHTLRRLRYAWSDEKARVPGVLESTTFMDGETYLVVGETECGDDVRIEMGYIDETLTDVRVSIRLTHEQWQQLAELDYLDDATAESPGSVGLPFRPPGGDGQIH
jgi:hypothetical protein